MKIFKVILSLLIIGALIFSIKLFLTFNQLRTVGLLQILLFCFLAAIPILMGLWVLLKKKGKTGIQKKNIIWSLAILTMGIIWLFMVKQNQDKRTNQMIKVEQSTHIEKE